MNAFKVEQLQALALTFLKLNGQLFNISFVFFGFSLDRLPHFQVDLPAPNSGRADGDRWFGLADLPVTCAHARSEQAEPTRAHFPRLSEFAEAINQAMGTSFFAYIASAAPLIPQFDNHGACFIPEPGEIRGLAIQNDVVTLKVFVSKQDDPNVSVDPHGIDVVVQGTGET